MSSSPTKKRKANDDGRRAADAQDVSTNNNDLSQKMDTMMQIMMGMQEKLISMESRCEQLEAKCSSLENIVGTKIDSLQLRMEERHAKEQKTLNYHEMLIKNQHWKYSPKTYSAVDYINDGFDEDEARYLELSSHKLKEFTKTMRRGEFNVENWYTRNDRGIFLTLDELDFPTFSEAVNGMLHSHWIEFLKALEQFTPALETLPDDCASFLSLNYLRLNSDVKELLKKAVMNAPFEGFHFLTHGHRGMSINDILDIVHNNEHVQRLDISQNLVDRVYIEKICSTIHVHPVLVDLNMSSCMYREDGVGDDMMISLLTYGNLKLQRLAMSYNRITSNATTQLSEFLANNPPLKWLELDGNRLTDIDAELLADALRSNSSLRHLALEINTGITYVGGETFHTVLCDHSTLNAVSDSNHSCCIKVRDQRNWNVYRPWDKIRTWDMKDLRKETAMNRAQKLYRLLSSRNRSMSNVQHFDDIDVKILPNMIEAVHRCRFLVEGFGFDPNFVNSLSIVYEVMRKWEKVFPLYNLEGRNTNPQQSETGSD